MQQSTDSRVVLREAVLDLVEDWLQSGAEGYDPSVFVDGERTSLLGRVALLTGRSPLLTPTLFAMTARQVTDFENHGLTPPPTAEEALWVLRDFRRTGVVRWSYCRGRQE